MPTEYGLGAVPSPPDARDWPLQLAPLAAPLPARFVSIGMGPVLDQGSKPQCVAYASSGMLTWFGKRDAEGVIDFDENWLYQRCKDIDDIVGPGTDGRSAMRVLKNTGAKALNRPESIAHFRIRAYYAVPVDLVTLKTALTQYGPILLGSAWYDPWFSPVNGIIGRKAGAMVGGHATLLFGWDDNVGGGSLLIRNSWGHYAGSTNGNFYAPVRYFLPETFEAWKAVDLVTHVPAPR